MKLQGSKRYSSDLEQGGLEIPAKIIFQNSNERIIEEMKKAHYKTDLKNVVTMPSHQGYCLTCTYGCIRFYCPKVRGSQVIGA